jgi:hypothetical protein
MDGKNFLKAVCYHGAVTILSKRWSLPAVLNYFGPFDCIYFQELLDLTQLDAFDGQ